MERNELVLTVAATIFAAAIEKGILPAEEPNKASHSIADLGSKFTALALEVAKAHAAICVPPAVSKR